ncbi:unnamed protein product [Staurois parvus]|uniref:Uncharacterized protein n=1 Tax=Staurois parvus TaxID=386267 RepID=A0ABN9C0E8_9NEOB|nr:unnamed protein product [Staurois parvus]
MCVEAALMDTNEAAVMDTDRWHWWALKGSTHMALIGSTEIQHRRALICGMDVNW